MPSTAAALVADAVAAAVCCPLPADAEAVCLCGHEQRLVRSDNLDDSDIAKKSSRLSLSACTEQSMGYRKVPFPRAP